MAESGRTRTGPFQILTLEPLESPWSEWPETSHVIVRLDDRVRRAGARELWQAAGRTAA